MIREVKFESQDRRIKQILAALNANGIKDIEEANAICEKYGIDLPVVVKPCCGGSSVGVAINMSTMEFFVVIVSFRMFFSGETKANIIPSYIYQNATTNVTDIAVAVAEIKAFMGL